MEITAMNTKFLSGILAVVPLTFALAGCSVNVDRDPSARVVHDREVHVVHDQPQSHDRDRSQTIVNPDGTRIYTRD
jgi:hypothetical protein